MSNVPALSITPAGPIAPPESAIFAGVTADINAAFGGNLNPDPTTPQGQLATAITAMIGAINDEFLSYIAGVDPSYSSGRMQDGIARIYFLTREPAEPTTVIATCSGATGTVIPVGALALASDGSKWACTQAGTIPLTGSVNLTFSNTVTGPAVLAPGALNRIYQVIPGWDSILNAGAGVLGRDVETRAAFEQRRAASVAVNSLSTVSAVRGAVLSVPNVLDCYVTENYTGAPVTINGVTLAANSLYVAVSGGIAADVAKAIWRKKPPGCAYNGATTITVTDDNAGYSLPYPTYSVSFTEASALVVSVQVTIANSINVPANALALVQGAVLQAFSGLDGGSHVQIGATLFAARFFAGIAALGTWAQVISIQLASANSGGAFGNEVLVHIDQIPTITAANVRLALA